METHPTWVSSMFDALIGVAKATRRAAATKALWMSDVLRLAAAELDANANEL